MAEAPAKASEAPRVRGACRMCGADVLNNESRLKNPETGQYEHRYHKDCNTVGLKRFQMMELLKIFKLYVSDGQGYYSPHGAFNLADDYHMTKEYFGESIPDCFKASFANIEEKVLTEESERAIQSVENAIDVLAYKRKYAKEAQERLTTFLSKKTKK